MAVPDPTTTPRVARNVMQVLIDLRLNAFAAQLFAESFTTPEVRAYAAEKPLVFTLEGMEFSVKTVGEPVHPRVRRELGLDQ